MNDIIDKERAIRSIARSTIRSFASGASINRYVKERDNKRVANMQKYIVFIPLLGIDAQYYSKYSYPYGKTINMILEELALTIEELIYRGEKHVQVLSIDNVKQEDCINYWNSICNNKCGYDIVLDELDKNLPFRFSV